jgi:uncharacterized protein (TIGR02145 family)
MRKLVLIVSVLFILVDFAKSQVAVNLDGGDPDASAILDISSTTSGFLPPRMTTAQRNGIVSPAEGLMVYNTDDNSLQFYNGSAWYDLSKGQAYAWPIQASYCNATYTFDEISSPSTSEVWLDRNIGAANAAVSAYSHNAYGSLVQWGRLADGHECILWSNQNSGTPFYGTTFTLSTSANTSGNADIPDNNMFIINSTLPRDWRSPQNDNLWQGVSGINNPCPQGYRIPIETEWCNEIDNCGGSITDLNTAFAALRITSSGLRTWSGTLSSAGTSGNYWSSTVNGSYSRFMRVTTVSADVLDEYRGSAMSVRCIKD